MRRILEVIIDLVGIFFGAVCMLALLEAIGIKWTGPITDFLAIFDLPGQTLEKLLVQFSLPAPKWAILLFSFYVSMGLYFGWMTLRMARKHAASMEEHQLGGVSYLFGAMQEAAIMVVIWPARLCSDVAQKFWVLSPKYVSALILCGFIAAILSLLFGLAQFKPLGG